jgi:hypothetical protein
MFNLQFFVNNCHGKHIFERSILKSMACRMSYFKIFVLFSTSLKIPRLYLLISYTSMVASFVSSSQKGKVSNLSYYQIQETFFISSKHLLINYIRSPLGRVYVGKEDKRKSNKVWNCFDRFSARKLFYLSSAEKCLLLYNVIF